MKRLFTMAALVAAVSCSKDTTEDLTTTPTGEMVEFSVTVNVGNDETRVAADVMGEDEWSFVWEDDDEITATRYNSYTTLTMSSFNRYSSTFVGYIEWYDEKDSGGYRLVHPAITSNTIDISAQDGTLDKCYLISDDLLSNSWEATFEPTMKHLGAFMQLNIDFSAITAGTYTLTSVELSDVPTSATLDALEGTLSGETSGTIVVTFAEPIAVGGSTLSVPVNILPDSYSGVTVTLNLEDEDGTSYTADASKTFDGIADVARAEVQPISLTCGKISKEETVVYWALSEFSESKYPTDTTWYISDETVSYYSDFMNLYFALNAVSKTTDNITLVFSNLTAISDDAFMETSNLTLPISMEFPVAESVGIAAFGFCTYLTSIELPMVTSVGDYAFTYCTSLTSIELPMVTSVGDNAFYNCSNLTSIELPIVTSVGDYAFYNCTSLTSMDLGSSGTGVTSLGTNTFSGASTEDTALTIKIADSSNISVFQNTRLNINNSGNYVSFKSMNGVAGSPLVE